MFFRLNINSSEDDYLAFHCFQSFETARGKKMVKKSRFSFILTNILLAVLVVLVLGWTTSSMIYTTLLLLVTLLYMIFYKKILTRNLKANIKRVKKTGKLPFDPVSTLEFYEDKLVETTPSKRTEYKYDVLERICIISDRYIYLYLSSVSAITLPVAQIRAQVNQEDFIDFLSKKCTTVEYH